MRPACLPQSPAYQTRPFALIRVRLEHNPLPVHIDPSDPDCAEAASEILRRHDAGELEANITTAVRDFLIRTRLVNSNQIVEENRARPGLPPRRRPHRPRHLRRGQAQDRHRRRLPTRPRERQAARRLPGPVPRAGPRPHGRPYRRQALAAALARRRSGHHGPAVRLHPRAPRPLDRPIRVAPRPRPLRRGRQAPLPRYHRRALRPQQPLLPARHSRPSRTSTTGTPTPTPPRSRGSYGRTSSRRPWER